MAEKYILDASKILWHRERIEQWRRGERVAPITIDLLLWSNAVYQSIRKS
mgnify:CR=1 FL=1